MKDASQPEAWRNVHLYACGFPCQPWSVAGKMQGTNDGRGRFFGDIHQRIAEGLPQCFLIENVAGLTTANFRSEFAALLTVLRGINGGAYNVMWSEMHSDLHGGLPQNRKRVYIVGILKKSQIKPFEFPNQLPRCLSLTQVLGPHLQKPLPDLRSKTSDENGCSLNKSVQANLRRFAEKVAGTSEEIQGVDYIIDTGSSKGHAMKSRCPCLTSTRCSSRHGYYSVSRDRFLDARDFLKLQVSKATQPGSMARCCAPQTSGR